MWGPARPLSARLCPHPSLSGLKLLSEHLDPKLLSRLKKLQELDLSNNQLETLPANLGLPLSLIHISEPTRPKR